MDVKDRIRGFLTSVWDRLWESPFLPPVVFLFPVALVLSYFRVRVSIVQWLIVLTGAVVISLIIDTTNNR